MSSTNEFPAKGGIKATPTVDDPINSRTLIHAAAALNQFTV